MAHGDQLSLALEPGVLFQNLQEMGPFSRSQAIDILNQGLDVGVGNVTVDINSNLIESVDEFTVQVIE